MDEPILKPIADAVARLEELLALLPDALAKDLRAKIATLRALLLEQRPPALVLIGRRGAGKSSVINALFGEKVAEVGHVKSQTGRGRWYDYTSNEGSLSILDTRGTQEASRPEEEDTARTAIDSILLELKRKGPDLILFVVKASEADAAIEADIDAVGRVADEVFREHKVRPSIVAIVTHCDLLEPKGVRLHQPSDEVESDLQEKLLHVAMAERLIEKHLLARPAIASAFVKALGVSTYLSWRADGSLRSDERWKMAELSELLFRQLPDASRGHFARIAKLKSLQEELAMNLARATAGVCAGIAAIPIPVADLVPITAMQLSMITAIAWISGRSLDKRAARDFLGGLGVNVGAAFAFREAARALVKYVFPGAGLAVSSAVAFAGTMGIAAAASSYFIRGESIDHAKRAFDTARDESRDESRDEPR